MLYWRPKTYGSAMSVNLKTDLNPAQVSALIEQHTPKNLSLIARVQKQFGFGPAGYFQIAAKIDALEQNDTTSVMQKLRSSYNWTDKTFKLTDEERGSINQSLTDDTAVTENKDKILAQLHEQLNGKFLRNCILKVQQIFQNIVSWIQAKFRNDDELMLKYVAQRIDHVGQEITALNSKPRPKDPPIDLSTPPQTPRASSSQPDLPLGTALPPPAQTSGPSVGALPCIEESPLESQALPQAAV